MTLFLIVLVNAIVEYIILFLVQKVGYKTLSQKMNAISKMIFYAQLMNTGFLRIISNSSFKNTPLAFLGVTLGNYNEFSKSWYLDVGAEIVEVMLIQAFIPFVQLGIIVARIMV